MGVPGLWDLLRPAGRSKSLTNIAVVEGFQLNRDGKRGYRIGIDASIWFFHAAYGKEGENPELRTLFFRLCRLAQAPFLPLLVFDGPYRPAFKRGKRVNAQKQHWLESGVKRMITAFGWEWRQAPGEAEAELAYLNSIGAIDAVLSDDVDNFLFGATVVIRNPSNNLSGNRSKPTLNSDGRDDGQHSMVYYASDFVEREDIGLTRNGMILIGLLSGGDYEQDGVFRCGKVIAQGLAKCGFGDTLVNAFLTLDRADMPAFLEGWRAELVNELRTNARGLIGRKNPSLAASIPASFPRLDVLESYITPITTESRGKTVDTSAWWSRDMDIAEVAACCEQFFEWGIKDIIVKRFRTVLWPGACCRILRQAAIEQDRRPGSSRRDATATPTKVKSKRPPVHLSVGTPSKLITKYFSKMGLDSPEKFPDVGNDQDEADPLMIKIHSSRQHASTDKILEYRVEVAPQQLVTLAESGVKGTRNAEDLELGDTFSDLERDDDEDGGGKKKTKAPPDPASTLRIWLPASMMEYVQPRLVEEFEAKEAAKAAKKANKGQKKIKAATKKPTLEESDEDSQPAPAAKGKGKAKPTAAPSKPKAVPQKSRRLWESSDSEDEDIPRPKTKVTSVVNTDDDNDLPARLKQTPPPQKGSASSRLAAFPMSRADTDTEEDPLRPASPTPRPMSKSRPKAPVPVPVPVPQPEPIVASKKKAIQPPKTKPKATVKTTQSTKLSTAISFFDTSSDEEVVVAKKKPATTAQSYSLKAPPKPSYSRGTSTTSSRTLAESLSSAGSTAADSSPGKKAKARLFASSPSASDAEIRKSPRKSVQQTSPERPRPISPSPSPSPVKVARRAVPRPKAAAVVDYIEISDSSDEAPALQLKGVVTATRERSTSGVPPKKASSTTNARLSTFGFAATKGGLKAHKPRREPVVPDDIIDLT